MSKEQVIMLENIIAFEASAQSSSVAVMRDGVVVAETRHDACYGHAAWIAELARKCIKQAEIEPQEITAVLGGRGPGSFTGIRVALAAAKGFMLARGVSGYGFSSLLAMAQSASNGDHPVAAVVESRKGTFFVLALAKDGILHKPPQSVSPEDIGHYLAGLVKFNTGNHWHITGHTIAGIDSQFEQNGITADFHRAEPLASHLCVAFNRLPKPISDKNRADLALEPLYLSPPLLGPR